MSLCGRQWNLCTNTTTHISAVETLYMHFSLKHWHGYDSHPCCIDEETPAQRSKRTRFHSAGNWWGQYLKLMCVWGQWVLTIMQPINVFKFPEKFSFHLILAQNQGGKTENICFNLFLHSDVCWIPLSLPVHPSLRCSNPLVSLTIWHLVQIAQLKMNYNAPLKRSTQRSISIPFQEA